MSLKKHSVMNLAGALAPMAVSVLTVPQYLKLIGPERYGVLAVLWALLGYFSFFDLGLGRALAQRMATPAFADPAARSRLAWTALLTSGGLALVGNVVLWLAADWLVVHLFDLPPQSQTEARLGARWLTVLLPITLLSASLHGALQARMQFLSLNAAQFIGTTLGQLLPLAMALSGRTTMEFLIPSVVAARLLTLAVLARQASKHVPLQAPPRADRSELRYLLNYGTWSSLTALIGPLLVTVDRFVLAGVTGPASVAFYTVPYDLAVKAMVVSTAVSSALAPRLAASGQTDAATLASAVTVQLGRLMSLPLSVGMVLIAPLMTLWLGRALAPSSQGVAEWILLGVWLHAVVTPHHSRLLAQDGPRPVFLVYVLQLPVYLPMLWFAVSRFGVKGAAVAWALRVGMDVVMLLWVSSSLRVLRQLWQPTLLVCGALAIGLTTELLVARLAAGAGLALLGTALNWTALVETTAGVRARFSRAS